MAKGKIWASCKLVRDRQFTRTRLGKLYPVSCCTALASPLLPNIPVERPLVKFFSPHFFHILRKRQKWAQKPQAGISRRRLRKQAYLFFDLTRAEALATQATPHSRSQSFDPFGKKKSSGNENGDATTSFPATKRTNSLPMTRPYPYLGSASDWI